MKYTGTVPVSVRFWGIHGITSSLNQNIWKELKELVNQIWEAHWGGEGGIKNRKSQWDSEYPWQHDFYPPADWNTSLHLKTDLKKLDVIDSIIELGFL